MIEVITVIRSASCSVANAPVVRTMDRWLYRRAKEDPQEVLQLAEAPVRKQA